MKRTGLTASIFAGFAGALAPGVLILLKGIVFAALWGPTARIAAFLSPWSHRGVPPGATLVDAVIGFLVGATLAFVVTRFAHDRTWRLALVFFGGFLIASLALVLFRGGLAQTSAVMHQTIMLTFIVASAAVFVLFPRPVLVARPPAR